MDFYFIKMNITILSDGGWATAIAFVLCQNNHKVTMWGPFHDYIEEMENIRENIRFLKGYPLPQSLKLQKDISLAVEDAEMIVLASPTQYMRGTIDSFKPFFNKKQHLLVNVAKGIENDSLLRISELVSDVLGQSRFVALSGPSHAEEVAKQVPTAIVAASENVSDAELVQNAFINDYFRVYTSDDVLGVELGGALKNVLAVAAGIIDGMGLGDNPKAALMTRGIAEMARLGIALGGKQETFGGLSGIGDLIVTCSSKHSRNRFVGDELGKGNKMDDIAKGMGMVVAEGVTTAKSAYELSSKMNIETPIIDEVYNIIYKNKSSKQAVKNLMTRKARRESDFA